jgi:hypothetical protein
MDPEMKKLLEEIRDLHKEHLERYKAFAERSMRLQELHVRRFRIIFVFFGIIGLVSWLVFLAWSSMGILHHPREPESFPARWYWV